MRRAGKERARDEDEEDDEDDEEEEDQQGTRQEKKKRRGGRAGAAEAEDPKMKKKRPRTAGIDGDEEEEKGEEEEEEDENKKKKKKKVRVCRPKRMVGQTASDHTKHYFLGLLVQHIPKMLERTRSEDRAALKRALQQAVQRVSDRLDRQLLPPFVRKPPDYAHLDSQLTRYEHSVAANTTQLVRLTSEVEHKRSEKEQEEQRLADLQQKMKEIERKQQLMQKKGKLNPSLDIFGKREYAHPLLAPDSELVSLSVPLTSVPVDPELLVELVDEEADGQGNGKDNQATAQPVEIDVVQGIVDDLAQITGKRAHLLPLMEDITTARDRLCTALSQVGDGVDPLHFMPSSYTSSL